MIWDAVFENMHVVLAVLSGMCTYSLGFFLGPGLALSLGGAFGSIDGGARFRPVTVPPGFLRLLSGFGGANELVSCSSLAVDGKGVELDSDDFSADSGGCTDGDGSTWTGDGEAGLTSDGNCASTSGDRRNTIILLFLPPFDVDLVVELVDDIVGDGRLEGSGVGDEVVDYRDAFSEESSNVRP